MSAGTPVLLCVAVAVAIAAAAPLIHLLLRVSTADPERLTPVLFRPRTLELLSTSIVVAGATSAGAFVLGVATAWVLTRVALPWGGVWRIAACLPLAVPSFVAAFGWMGVFPGLSGIGPLVVVLVLSTAPYVTVPTMAAFVRADQAVTDAAVSLGRSPRRAFLTVTLPQVLPSALAGTLLVALYALSDFGAPALLRVDTLTTGIYAQFTGGIDRALSAALALVLAALAVTCVVAEGAFPPSVGAARAGPDRPAAAAGALRPPATALLVGMLGAVATASVIVPPAALLARLPAADRYLSTGDDLFRAAATTLALGICAAFVTVVAALPISWLAARRPRPIVSLLESITYVGHALPGLVVALALVSLTVANAPAAYQGPLALIVAYVVLFLPKAVGSTRAAVAGVRLDLEDAARSLGDAPARSSRG